MTTEVITELLMALCADMLLPRAWSLAVEQRGWVGGPGEAFAPCPVNKAQCKQKFTANEGIGIGVPRGTRPPACASTPHFSTESSPSYSHPQSIHAAQLCMDTACCPTPVVLLLAEGVLSTKG